MTRALPFILALVLLIYCLIDCLQTPKHKLRPIGRFGWILVIVLVPVIGPIAWLATTGYRGTGGAPTRPKVRAPEDDPDFLRQLREVDLEHQRMLAQWEIDLRNREGKLPKRRKRTDPPSSAKPGATQPGDGQGKDMPAEDEPEPPAS